MAATLGSETTAAITGKVGVVRRDPLAMLPFCGYHMGDYFAHWLKIGRAVKQPPKIFRVNWFRRDANGKFIWPGFGENMRVLKWIVERCEGKAQRRGNAARHHAALRGPDWTGLEKLSPAQFAELERVDNGAWREELSAHDELFGKFGARLPRGAGNAPRQHAPEARRLARRSQTRAAAGERAARRGAQRSAGGQRRPPSERSPSRPPPASSRCPRRRAARSSTR